MDGRAQATRDRRSRDWSTMELVADVQDASPRVLACGRRRRPTRARLQRRMGVHETSLLKTSDPKGPTCEDKGEELTREGRGS